MSFVANCSNGGMRYECLAGGVANFMMLYVFFHGGLSLIFFLLHRKPSEQASYFGIIKKSKICTKLKNCSDK